jgi:hypothetical protein
MVICNSYGYEYESKVFQTPDEETDSHFNFHHIIIGLRTHRLERFLRLTLLLWVESNLAYICQSISARIAVTIGMHLGNRRDLVLLYLGFHPLFLLGVLSAVINSLNFGLMTICTDRCPRYNKVVSLHICQVPQLS